MSQTPLKPCPCCGGSAAFDHDDAGWNWVVCADCGLSSNCMTSCMDDCRPILAEHWNRRAASSSAASNGDVTIVQHINLDPGLAGRREVIDAIRRGIERSAQAAPPPVLPVELLNLIGEYGMARTDGVSQLEVQHRWECLIRGIKAYAVGIPRAGVGIGLKAGLDAGALVSATAKTISRLLLGDARKVDCDIIESHIRELLAAAAQSVEVEEIAEIVESLSDDEPLDAAPTTALAQTLAAQLRRLREEVRAVSEVEYVVNCMAEDDRTGCGSKTDLGRDLERQVQRLYEEIETLQTAADRYRWLREQHWNESSLAVVCDPKKAVKLGYDCPSGERLDEAIDTAMTRKQPRGAEDQSKWHDLSCGLRTSIGLGCTCGVGKRDAAMKRSGEPNA